MPGQRRKLKRKKSPEKQGQCEGCKKKAQAGAASEEKIVPDDDLNKKSSHDEHHGGDREDNQKEIDAESRDAKNNAAAACICGFQIASSDLR